MKNLKRSTFALSILIALLAVTGCTNSDDAKRTLESAGYSDIKTGGYDFFACGKDDTVATKFSARNPAGKMTTGTVCSGLLFKSSTIRH